MVRRTTKHALIAGATGVTGQGLLDYLLDQPEWEITTLSRSRPDRSGSYRHLDIDLLDRDATMNGLGAASGVTHAFFAAYINKGGGAADVLPNVAMLRNLLDAVEFAAPSLQHLNLVHGTKWYGSHLGPFKTPSRENDPRHVPPNFYYDQQDLVAERQAGRAWTWSAARPHTVCGFALGNPMNIVMVLTVYASLCKSLGLPLRYPGTKDSFEALYQLTDARHLAKALVWMSTETRCANQAFNITNGDIFRWKDIWPQIAQAFGMEAATIQTISLAERMPQLEETWNRLVAAHDLRPIAFDRIASWSFGDFVFATRYDVVSSMTKARQFGFVDVIDSEHMLLTMIEDFRRRRIIP